MTFAKVINVGQEQLIALPTGYHVDAEKVEIFKEKGFLFINTVLNYSGENQDAKSAHSNHKETDFYQSLLQWRDENGELLDDSDPWVNVRSQEVGRENNWGELV